MISYFLLLVLPFVKDFAEKKGMDAREIEEGYSATPIYLLSTDENPELIVKVYEFKSPELINDLKGQKAALALDLFNLRVPRILQIHYGDNQVIVSQEFVPGKSLWKIKDPEVFKKLGRGLREFHDRSTWQYAPPSKVLLEHLDWVIDKGINKADQLGYSSIEMKKQIGSLSNDPIPWSLLHHDPQLGNYLYDEKTGKLSMIDLGDGAHFIDSCGRGLGTPLYDYVKVLYHLSKLPKELMAAFKQGYGLIGDEKSIRYFTMVVLLSSIDWHLKTHGVIPDRLLASVRALFGPPTLNFQESEIQTVIPCN